MAWSSPTESPMGLAPSCHTLEPPALYRPRNAPAASRRRLEVFSIYILMLTASPCYERKYAFARFSEHYVDREAVTGRLS